MYKLKKYIPAGLMFTPALVLAAKSIEDLITQVHRIIVSIVPILIAIALIIFIWGVIQYITAGDSEEKRSAARNTIIYGVIGLFAIVAVWGLVEIIRQTFGVIETTIPTPTATFPTQ